jgi:genome maintenance exonuclease 1
MAHDFVYKTAITKAVIMMCSKDNFYQEFVIAGEEYRKYKHKWLERVNKYYESKRLPTSVG